MNESEKREEELYLQGLDAFKAANPDWSEPEPIKCLNLIMRRENAEDILAGRKTVEFRAWSQHYIDRLYDKKTLRYIEQHKGEPGVAEYCDPVRIVKKIRLHDYNNSWHLECEVEDNHIVAVWPEDVKFLQDEFGCHELDEQLAACEAAGDELRPCYFYFALGKILGESLTKKRQ